MRGWLLLVRRGGGLLAAPGLVLLALVAMNSRGRPWVGEWAWTVDWLNGTTILLGPLTAAVVAFDVQRWSGPTWRALARQTRRPAGLALHAAAGAWVWATVAWLLAMVTALLLSLAAGARGHVPLLPMVMGPLALAAFASLGAGIGFILPRPAAAPVAGVGTFALTYLAAAGVLPGVLRVGGATASLVGLRWDDRVWFVQTVALVTICLVVALLTRRAAGPASGIRQLSATVAASALLLAAVANLAVSGDQRLVIRAGPVALACAGAAPVVCMARDTSVALKALERAMHEQARVLEAAGVELPARYVQEIPGHPPSPNAGLIVMSVDQVNSKSVDLQSVPGYLTLPTPCAEYFAPTPPELALQARQVLADWITSSHSGTGQPRPAQDQDPENQWLRSDPQVQRTWVRTTFVQLRSCDLGAVRLPF
jgi:hypothetical protein